MACVYKVSENVRARVCVCARFRDRCRSCKTSLRASEVETPGYELHVNQEALFIFFIGGGFKLKHICVYEATQTTHAAAQHTQERDVPWVG